MDARSHPPTAPREIRVLTLNLWGTNGPVEERLEHLARHLVATRPDLVALQEVRRMAGRPQSDLLADACGYGWAHYGHSWRRGDEEEGLAVLSHLPIEVVPSTALPCQRRDVPRQLQRVRVHVHGRSLVLANTHLTWRRRHGHVRLEQVRRIRDVLAREDGPVVLAGDLNASPRTRALRLLLGDPPQGAGLHDALAVAVRRPSATFAFRNPFAAQPWLLGRRVDHLLVSPELRVIDARRVLTGVDAPVVSDHYGVRADLAVPLRAD